MSYSGKSDNRVRYLSAIVFLLALPALLALGSGGCGKKEEAFGKDVVAIVKGKPITLDEYKAEVGVIPDKPEAREAALMQMIDRKLVSELALSEGMLGDPSVFTATEAAYIEKLPDFLHKRLFDEAVVSDDELTANKKDFKANFQVSMVVVQTITEAESALADLKKGASFTDVSKKYSTLGGDTEKTISLDDDLYPVGVKAVLNRMEPGSLSPAMKIELGYIILKLNRRVSAEDQWKAQVEKQRERIKQVKADKQMAEILDRQRRTARIKMDTRKLPDGEVRYYGAEVNGIKITVDPTMYDAPSGPHSTHQGLNTQTIKFMLDKKVNGLLLSQEAKGRGLQYDPEFQKILEYEKEQALFEAYIKKVRGNVDVTPKDMQDYYNKNKDKLALGASVRVSRILLPTKDAADKALGEIKAGKDFAALAREMSEDKVSGKKGGDVGFVKPDKLEESVKGALSKIKPGDVTGVLKTKYGFEILKATDRKEGGVPEMSNITGMLREKIILEKTSDRVEAFYKMLHEKADIKINKKLLESLKG